MSVHDAQCAAVQCSEILYMCKIFINGLCIMFFLLIPFILETVILNIVWQHGCCCSQLCWCAWLAPTWAGVSGVSAVERSGEFPIRGSSPAATVVMNLSRLLGLPGVARTATLPPRTARSAHSGRTSRRSGRTARSKTRTSVRQSSHRNKKVCLEFINSKKYNCRIFF